jgi:hypothetical protein
MLLRHGSFNLRAEINMDLQELQQELLNIGDQIQQVTADSTEFRKTLRDLGEMLYRIAGRLDTILCRECKKQADEEGLMSVLRQLGFGLGFSTIEKKEKKG